MSLDFVQLSRLLLHEFPVLFDLRAFMLLRHIGRQFNLGHYSAREKFGMFRNKRFCIPIDITQACHML